jgi:iron(III) transport system permease protein
LFFIPGILLGRTLIAALNGTVVYGTAALVVAAFTLRYLAIGWEGASAARRALDRDLTDAARLSGARGWTLFRHVHWPHGAPSLGATWYVIYLLCLWDVETLVLIQPPGGETLALRAFNLLHYGHHAQANALCVTLLVLALTPLGAWLLLHRLFRRP